MLGLFYQYLIRHHKIVLPGLGTVVLHRQSSVAQFAEHEILPPSYTFQWIQANGNPPVNFFVWMAHKLGIAEDEAAIRINSYIADVKREINAGKEIQWNGVGIIRRGWDSGIELEPEQISLAFQKPVHAEKVAHGDASHLIIVGDQEKTSQEMTEILNHPVEKKIRWITISWIAVVLLAVFILAYFWKYGLTTSSVSNQKKLTPKEAPAGYKQAK